MVLSILSVLMALGVECGVLYVIGVLNVISERRERMVREEQVPLSQVLH